MCGEFLCILYEIRHFLTFILQEKKSSIQLSIALLVPSHSTYYDNQT